MVLIFHRVGPPLFNKLGIPPNGLSLASSWTTEKSDGTLRVQGGTFATAHYSLTRSRNGNGIGDNRLLAPRPAVHSSMPQDSPDVRPDSRHEFLGYGVVDGFPVSGSPVEFCCGPRKFGDRRINHLISFQTSFYW